jgi:hypothetical protein
VRETIGQAGASFVDQRLDFRSFGRCTSVDWAGLGLVAAGLAKFTLFEKVSTPERAERVMVSSTELLSEDLSRAGVQRGCRHEGGLQQSAHAALDPELHAQLAILARRVQEEEQHQCNPRPHCEAADDHLAQRSKSCAPPSEGKGLHGLRGHHVQLSI